jgi:hypothetical protein
LQKEKVIIPAITAEDHFWGYKLGYTMATDSFVWQVLSL